MTRPPTAQHIQRGQAIREKDDFAFATTLAGRTHLSRISRMLGSGWRVELIYLALPSIEISRRRVAERVAHGGHNISAQELERRFPRSLINLLITLLRWSAGPDAF